MEHDEPWRRFDVAVWRRWPPASDSFPILGVVTAWNAAEAVEAVMRTYGLREAGHVAAAELGGRFLHRAYEVRLREEGAFVQRLAMASQRKGR